MKFIILTNTFNPHMTYLAEALFEILGNDFLFISIDSLSKERLDLGWVDEMHQKYHIKYHANVIVSQKYILEADVVYFGANRQHFTFIKERLRNKKTTLFHLERLFKENYSLLKLMFFYPLYLSQRVMPSYQSNNHTLAVGSYLYNDYKKIFASTERMYNFGYFPKLYHYNLEELMLMKDSDEIRILMTTRFIKLKRVDEAIDAVSDLIIRSSKKVLFRIIGTGPMRASYIRTIKRKGLEGSVSIEQPKKPEEIRKLMENSQIYIMASDKNEGWGVVVNEAMNSGCAVIVSADVGSTKFLIEDKFNGLVYNRNIKGDLAQKVLSLIESKSLMNELGSNAYRTISSEWNHNVAASRLIETFLENKSPDYDSGPLSRSKMG